MAFPEALTTILKMKWFPESGPPKGSYAKQTVLVTGGNGGIGLAAAHQYLSLGATEVIITARNTTKGERAKAQLQFAAPPGTVVRVLPLDMNSYESIVQFVDLLKREYSGRGGLDTVLLNAGVFGYHFTKSPRGWEQDLQTNAISTALLASLFIPWMKSLRAQRTHPAHLVFTSSGLHRKVNAADLLPAAKSKEGVLAYLSREENYPGFQMKHNISKLMLVYCIEEIVKLARGPDGEPQVIVTSFCPGMVKTDLGAPAQAGSRVIKVIAPIYFATLAQTAEVGTRICAEAGLCPPEEHGKFLFKWTTREQYAEESAKALTTPAARELQALAWKEIRAELVTNVPQLGMAL